MKYRSVVSAVCHHCHAHAKTRATSPSMGDHCHYTMIKNRNHSNYNHHYSAVSHNTHHYNDHHHHHHGQYYHQAHRGGANGGGRSAIDIIAELGSESNAHGLAKIVTSRDTKRKVIWALLVIVGFTAATLQLSLLVRKYLQFQVVELSEIKDSMPVEFPSVTICNIEPIALKNMHPLPKNDTPIYRWLKFIHLYSFRPMTFFGSARAFYENLAEDARNMSHSLDDMLVHCRFNREKCSPDNFTYSFDGNYFSCFTFNGGQLGNQLKMHSTGPENGLSLIISIEKFTPSQKVYGVYNSDNNILHSAGVRVVVHAPGTMPSPVDHGFDIPPGYSSSVGLKAVLHTRLSKPYGNCTEGALDGVQSYRNTFFACLQLCKQRLIIENCKCKSSALPDVPEPNVTFCGSIPDWPDILDNVTGEYKLHDFIETKGLDCSEHWERLINNDRAYEKNCGCYQPCSETAYLKSLSLSYWPLEFYQFDFIENVFGYKKPPNSTLSEADLFKSTTEGKHFMVQAYNRLDYLVHQDKSNISLGLSEQRELAKEASDLIRQNMLRLNIYLEDLSVVEYRQLPAYGLADLFADIGGTMGLWMGISVLTIMELCELVIRLLGLLFNSEKELPSSLIHPTTTTPSARGGGGGGGGGCCCGGGGCYHGNQCCGSGGGGGTSNGHGPYPMSNGDVEHGGGGWEGGGGDGNHTSGGGTDIGPSAFDFRRGVESPV